MKKLALLLILAACFNVQNLFSEDAAKEMNKTGAITAIDLQKMILSIERTTDKRLFTFVVSKEILSKFKVGQIVEVSYSKNDKGDRVASNVVIADKPAAAPAVPAAPAAPEGKAPAAPAPKKENKDDIDIGAPKAPGEKK